MDHSKSDKRKVEEMDKDELALETETFALRAKITRLEEENARLKEESLAKSLLSVLPEYVGQAIPRLELRGSKNSHLRPKNQDAEVIVSEFTIPSVRAADADLGLGLKDKVSSLRTIITNSEGSLRYENEYDVHDFIQTALRDATTICNEIIKHQTRREDLVSPPVLDVRRESILFSNILDHVVVFDVVSGAPVFSVETKKVWNDLPKGVFGQVYDQLCEMQAKGHPNPFGALTCFDSTYIVWLDNDSSKRVLKSLAEEEYGTNRLKRIVRGLLGAHHDASRSEQPFTQSPVKEKSPVKKKKSAGAQDGFTQVATRNVTRSAKILPEEVVAAFVCAIFCSLDGIQNPRQIKSFELKEQVEENALYLNKKSMEWGTFRATFKGPAKKSVRLPKLYLIDYLGMGSTSKVYRALTEEGYDCVVKIYVKRRGDNKVVLTKKVFDAEAQKAVAREVKAYKTIYGDELRGYVWQQKLNNHQCVIHPYFKHLDKEDRIKLLEQIRTRLNSFAKCGKAFATSDQVWRHVGLFNDKVYLFDLADLESGNADDVENHIKRLRFRQTGTHTVAPG
jgi:hypothetical protein